MSSFPVGSFVLNFNTVARVIAHDPERGLLVEIAEGSGADGQRYHAAEGFCRPARVVVTGDGHDRGAEPARLVRDGAAIARTVRLLRECGYRSISLASV
jgi:hypothetical protein